MNGRLNSLDALKEHAILGPVLSGSIAFGEMMPVWMFHAQILPTVFLTN